MEDKAMKLWIEWFEKDGNPLYANESGDRHCFFCGEESSITQDKDQNHDDTCIYLRAKKLIESSE